MAFCGHCGNPLDDHAVICPACGRKVEAAGAPSAAEQAGDFAAKVMELNNTADTTAAFDPADIAANKGMAVLSYFSWLVLIPLLAAKKSRFAYFHANQGLVLAIAEILWGIFTGIMTGILKHWWWFYRIASSLLSLCSLVFLAFAIIGIVNAVNGRAKELPLIGQIKILQY